jgi:hypothetical protein
MGSGVGTVTVAKIGACSEKRKEERRKKVDAGVFNIIKVLTFKSLDFMPGFKTMNSELNF